MADKGHPTRDLAVFIRANRTCLCHLHATPQPGKLVDCWIEVLYNRIKFTHTFSLLDFELFSPFISRADSVLSTKHATCNTIIAKAIKVIVEKPCNLNNHSRFARGAMLNEVLVNKWPTATDWQLEQTLPFSWFKEISKKSPYRERLYLAPRSFWTNQNQASLFVAFCQSTLTLVFFQL